MSNPPNALTPLITRAGLAAVRNAQGSGLKATIAAMSIGTGPASGASFTGYTPSAGQTALVNEKARVPLLSGSLLGGVAGGDPIGFRVQSVVPVLAAGSTSYPVCEVGIYLDDGTLLAVYSDPAVVLCYMTAQASLELAFDLFLQQLPVASMTIAVNEPEIPEYAGVLAKLLVSDVQLFLAQLKDEWRFPLLPRQGTPAS